MDFKHKLFETSKDTAPTINLPRLIFICANNHLYPITDETTRETIFKQHSKTGGAIKKYKAKQKFEHKMNNGTETQIHVHCEDMSTYLWFAGACLKNKENKHIWHSMPNRTKIHKTNRPI